MALSTRCRGSDNRSDPRPLLVVRLSRDYLTWTWKPASLSALTNSAASKSPVTSKAAVFGWTVSPETPATDLTVFLIVLAHCLQQLWPLFRLRLLTFPLGTLVSDLNVSPLLS